VPNLRRGTPGLESGLGLQLRQSATQASHHEQRARHAWHLLPQAVPHSQVKRVWLFPQRPAGHERWLDGSSCNRSAMQLRSMVLWRWAELIDDCVASGRQERGRARHRSSCGTLDPQFGKFGGVSNPAALSGHRATHELDRLEGIATFVLVH
jgi:hypothetical protein